VIRVENPQRIPAGAVEIDVDGVRVEGDRFAVPDDGSEHRVDVRMLERVAGVSSEAGDGTINAIAGHS
jgi:hypothetical protein